MRPYSTWSGNYPISIQKNKYNLRTKSLRKDECLESLHINHKPFIHTIFKDKQQLISSINLNLKLTSRGNSRCVWIIIIIWTSCQFAVWAEIKAWYIHFRWALIIIYEDRNELVMSVLVGFMLWPLNKSILKLVSVHYLLLSHLFLESSNW